jgi:hypothetical protein
MVNDADKLSPTVAILNVAELTPSLISNTLHTLLVTLHNYRFRVCGVVSDGASENIKVFGSVCTEPIGAYIAEDVKKQFPKVCFDDLMVVMRHPVTDEPIFVIEDMPHVVKRIVNAMESSSNPQTDRKLNWDGNPLELWTIRQVWEAVGGRSLRLQDTKLTMKHFVKDAYSRMRVYLAVQVLSRSVVEMIREARDDPEVYLPHESEMYDTLIELATHVNDMVDIVNGRSRERYEFTAHWTPDNAYEIQKKLLGILSWFSEWEDFVEEHPESTKHNFLSDPTWNGIRRMLLGYLGMIEYFVNKENYTIVPRRTTSDPCEHHFGGIRANSGSKNNPTGDVAEALTDRSDGFQVGRAYMKIEHRVSGGNNAHAPFEMHTRNCKF